MRRPPSGRPPPPPPLFALFIFHLLFYHYDLLHLLPLAPVASACQTDVIRVVVVDDRGDDQGEDHIDSEDYDGAISRDLQRLWPETYSEEKPSTITTVKA